MKTIVGLMVICVVLISSDSTTSVIGQEEVWSEDWDDETVEETPAANVSLSQL